MDKNFLNFIGGLFFVIMVPTIIGGLVKIAIEAPETCEQKINLFNGYGDNNFSIATIKIETNGSDSTITKKNIPNVQWAQLKLYPTIGCTRPTLFYMVENSQQVQKMEVNEAQVIK